jgi:hypothetical protein
MTATAAPAASTTTSLRVLLDEQDHHALCLLGAAAKPAARGPAAEAAAICFVRLEQARVAILDAANGRTPTHPLPKAAKLDKAKGIRGLMLDVDGAQAAVLRVLARGDDATAWADIVGGILRDGVAGFRADLARAAATV